MTEFISAAEASKLTRVSASTIKRFIHEVIGEDNHESRDKIQPSAEELQKAKEAGEPYRWKIQREFAIEQFGKAEDAKHNENSNGSDAVLEILREQLQSKDEQIRQLQTQLDRKDGQIARQDTLMQQSQSLMQDLQIRLALSSPAEATNTTSMKPVEIGEAPRKGMFGDLFKRRK